MLKQNCTLFFEMINILSQMMAFLETACKFKNLEGPIGLKAGVAEMFSRNSVGLSCWLECWARVVRVVRMCAVSCGNGGCRVVLERCCVREGCLWMKFLLHARIHRNQARTRNELRISSEIQTLILHFPSPNLALLTAKSMTLKQSEAVSVQNEDITTIQSRQRRSKNYKNDKYIFVCVMD